MRFADQKKKKMEISRAWTEGGPVSAERQDPSINKRINSVRQAFLTLSDGFFSCQSYLFRDALPATRTENTRLLRAGYWRQSF